MPKNKGNNTCFLGVMSLQNEIKLDKKMEKYPRNKKHGGLWYGIYDIKEHCSILLGRTPHKILQRPPVRRERGRLPVGGGLPPAAPPRRGRDRVRAAEEEKGRHPVVTQGAVKATPLTTQI